MADSKEAYGEGQAPMLCQICEMERGIEWKCLDCDLLMCQKCKEKIHPKFKLANEHKIVNIKDVGNKEIEVSSYEEEICFGNIKCTEHSEEICCLYCQLCDKLICMQCVTKTHKSHVFEEIKYGYHIKKFNLMKHTKTLKIQQETLTNEIEKLEKIKEENNLQHRQVKKDITTHEMVVTEEVENYTISVINKLDEKLGLLQQGTEKEIDRVKTMKEKIQEKLTKAEEFINIRDGATFFQNIEGVEKSLREDVQLTTFEKETMPIFVPGNVDQCNFGTLIYNKSNLDDEDKSCTKLELKIENEYQTFVPAVSKATQSSDGHIWIYSQTGESSILKKVKPTGNKLKEISTYKILVHGMTVTPCNDILLCTNQSRIKYIDNITGKLTNSKYDVGPRIPVAICLKEDFILVAVLNENYPKHGTRAVIKMNKNGRHVHTVEFREDKQPIFMYPLSLACTNDAQNIFVVDGFSHEFGHRIVIILQNNTIEYYQGHSSINSFNEPFTPMVIQAAKSNNIITTDLSTNTLHILSPSGQLCAYVDLKDIGIQIGLSLCCTSKQIFLMSIGCFQDRENESDQNQENCMAKLCELNIEGCSYLV